MNKILNDTERKRYEPVIAEMFDLCPETMSRKIPRANVQQAFVLDTVQKLAPSLNSPMLCVGSFEDTACESLIKSGYTNITSIDPAINMSLDKFFRGLNNWEYGGLDVIFSTSVIEHVDNDDLFIDQICKLLAPNGFAVLTCDFRDGYEAGDPKPDEDFRLYTKYDLLQRLKGILEKNGCELCGEINYDSEPDFVYGVHLYSFATYVFRKE